MNSRKQFNNPSFGAPSFGAGFGAAGFAGPDFSRRRPSRGEGPRGVGPWGMGPRGGGPRGGGPRGRGRIGRGQIRSVVLGLLIEEPMHGYEMIRRLEERSDGRWKPSPGAIYPTLSQLSDEGLVASTEDGGKRVFSLTDEGREAAEGLAAEDVSPWESAFGESTAFELRALAGQLGHAVRSVGAAGTPAQQERAKVVLEEARRSLYRILAEEPGADGEAIDGDSSEFTS